jgi:Icc-related predicted phosphoesterase
LTNCFFVSDLHGHVDRYRKLFDAMVDERPDGVFIGGDLLPSGLAMNLSDNGEYDDFITDFLVPGLTQCKEKLGDSYPRLFLIMGNDDFRSEESKLLEASDLGVLSYAHYRRVDFENFPVYGYSHVPPTPFQLKDWERYDVSRYVDLGSVSPERGARTVPISESRARYSTIKNDLDRLTGNENLSQSIFLFHTPPYKTHLDRAALDGKMIDYVQMDVHIGSIAVNRFIEARQPLVTLHGHVHESAGITGSWRDKIGRTHMFSAAHDGPQLALVRFEPENLEAASRELI